MGLTAAVLAGASATAYTSARQAALSQAVQRGLDATLTDTYVPRPAAMCNGCGAPVHAAICSYCTRPARL
jgi:hypothetical protein